MVRVLLIGRNSIISDLVESTLAHEEDLEVLRMVEFSLSGIDDIVREHSPNIIITVEEEMDTGFFAVRSLSRYQSCCRLIAISLERNLLNIFENYRLPVSGVAQIVNLVRISDHQAGLDYGG